MIVFRVAQTINISARTPGFRNIIWTTVDLYIESKRVNIIVKTPTVNINDSAIRIFAANSTVDSAISSYIVRFKTINCN